MPSQWNSARRRSRLARLSSSRRTSARSGLTLVEMLVAVTVSLILILAMVRIFEVIGENVSTGRAIVELQGQLRVVALRLQEDLEGLTVQARPWPTSASGQGYIEYLEGPGRDWDPSGAGSGIPITMGHSTLGDYDDVLMFTTRSTGEPFTGTYASQSIEAKVAEIVWWTQVNDENFNGVADDLEDVTLHRRVLLVRPDLNFGNGVLATFSRPAADLALLRDDIVGWMNANDVSVRIVTNRTAATPAPDPVVVNLVANTLSDLSKRENRVAHISVTFEAPPSLPPAVALAPLPFYPFPVQQNPTIITNPMDFATAMRSSTSIQQRKQQGLKQGEDVILSNALSFDLQAFDPLATIRGDGSSAVNGDETIALTPADPGWYVADPLEQLGLGAYVDLGYAPTLSPSSFFSALPVVKSGLRTMPTYDTWSFHYEHNGINEWDTAPIVAGSIDEGADNIDNDGSNGVDDMAERETSPPYPVALRGIRIQIRALEPDARQVRQITVTSDFVPE